MRIAALALGLVIAAGACASSGTAAGEPSVTASSTARRTNVISSQEIRESSAPSLADLIRQLRPGWPTAVSIVVNNDVMGGYDMLRSQPVSTVNEIRYLSKSEAQMKWGPRVNEVIQIITR
jgi:glutaredoxin-related protein